MQNLTSSAALVNDWMCDHGARFAVTHQGRRQFAQSPFDPLPRTVSAEEFTRLEQGLIQRINALNLFLCDIYQDRMILRDGVIPEEFVYASPDFRPECAGLLPPKGIYAHITATDLIRTRGGKWYVMEDVISVPDGITFPHLARRLLREKDPAAYQVPGLCDNCGLDILLRQLYRDVMDGDSRLEGGIVVFLTEGQDSLTDFEIRYMAELTGAVTATAQELIVMDNKVYYRAPGGGFQRVAVLHRMCLDALLDPLCFEERSPCGIPHLMEVYAAGNLAIINAPGCSAADDRGLGCFVPTMIRYYLDENPILPAVPFYLPWYEDQRAYILEHMDSLFFKDVSSQGRTAAIRGTDLTPQQRQDLAAEIQADPRRFIAQEILEADTLPVAGSSQEARVDLRAFTVHSDSIRVWMGGLTRFTVKEPDGSARVGFKDTWVMAE